MIPRCLTTVTHWKANEEILFIALMLILKGECFELNTLVYNTYLSLSSNSLQVLKKKSHKNMFMFLFKVYLTY